MKLSVITSLAVTDQAALMLQLSDIFQVSVIVASAEREVVTKRSDSIGMKFDSCKHAGGGAPPGVRPTRLLPAFLGWWGARGRRKQSQRFLYWKILL